MSTFYSLVYSCRYQFRQRKDGLLPNTPENTAFSPNKIRCHHPKCPKLLNNHCGGSNGSRTNKINNLQDPSKSSNNQINIIQANSNENISPDNSEIQSINNTLSATMDEKQKMLLLKIANNSIAAASAIAENDCGNVSTLFGHLMDNSLLLTYLLLNVDWVECWIDWSLSLLNAEFLECWICWMLNCWM